VPHPKETACSLRKRGLAGRFSLFRGVASAAAGPADSGCTDCAADLIAVTHNAGLNALLTRFGEQVAVVAGLLWPSSDWPLVSSPAGAGGRRP
jgi:hypothetical protein